jgi:ferrochelatase
MPQDGAPAGRAWLGWRRTQYTVTFQSRFGKAKWLEPYTEPTLKALAQGRRQAGRRGLPGLHQRLPGDAGRDQQEGREAFLQAGGKEFGYIPCLNDSHEWIAGLAEIAQQHLAGWPVQQADAAALAASRERALALGAAK